MLGNATGGIEQLIDLRCRHLVLGGVHLAQPRSFHIRILVLLTFHALVHGWTAEGFLGHGEDAHLAFIGDHVAVQLQVIHPRVTPHQPSLPVIINQYGGVDMIPGAVLEQRLTDGVTERSCGGIAHSHADGHATRQTGMGADIPEELPVALDALTRPGAIVSPGEALQRQR